MGKKAQGQKSQGQVSWLDKYKSMYLSPWFPKQDSIVLNIQRAVEATIDIAMYLVSLKKLGIPQNSRDAFEVLNNNNIINNVLLEKIKAMIGFRNIAVHNYQKLNLDILQKVIEKNLEDFEEFVRVVSKIE